MPQATSPRPRSEPVVILVAEDSKHDQVILQEVFGELPCNVTLDFVTNGHELLDYLNHRNAYAAAGAARRPALVLLDLNMPRMNGHEALRDIRATPELRMLPIVILSTSSNRTDITRSYTAGANSYMTKPAQFDDFVGLIGTFCAFWLEAVELPDAPEPVDPGRMKA